MTRKTYTMTSDDMETLLDAMKPVPQIMLQCGPTSTVQQNANNAWKVLGDKMGFKHMTARPGRSDLEFTAEPLEESA